MYRVIEQLFFNNRSSSEGACYGEDMAQDSSVGPCCSALQQRVKYKNAWSATHLCTNNKAAGYCKAMSKIIYRVGKKIKISHNLKSKEIKMMFSKKKKIKK